MAVNKIIPRTIEDLKQIEVNDMIEVNCRLFYMTLNKEEKFEEQDNGVEYNYKDMNDRNNKIIKYVYSGSYDKYGGNSIYYMYRILNGKDKIVEYNDCYRETDKLKFVRFGDMNFSDKLKNKLKINDNKKQVKLKESLDDNSCLIFRNRDDYTVTLTASEVLNLIATGQ